MRPNYIFCLLCLLLIQIKSSFQHRYQINIDSDLQISKLEFAGEMAPNEIKTVPSPELIPEPVEESVASPIQSPPSSSSSSTASSFPSSSSSSPSKPSPDKTIEEKPIQGENEEDSEDTEETQETQ